MGTVKKRIRYEYDALGNRSAMVDLACSPKVDPCVMRV